MMETESFRFKTVKTGFYILIWMNMGFSINIFGPTLKDLVVLLDTNYEEMGRSLAGTGIGGIVGSLFTFFVTDIFQKWLDLVLAVGLFIVAVSIACVPFIVNVNLLWLLAFLNGFSAFLINLVGQRILLLMWQKKASSPLHAIHMGYGLGACLIPLLANPFLAAQPHDHDFPEVSNNTVPFVRAPANTTTWPSALVPFVPGNRSVSPLYGINVTGDTKPRQGSRVQYVFILVAAFSLALCGISCVFHLLRKTPISSEDENHTMIVTRNTKTGKLTWIKTMLNPVTYTGGSMCYGLSIFALLLLYYINLVGGENMFGTFVRSFSIDQLEFDNDNASYLNVVYWLSFSIGRLLGSLIAPFVAIERQIVGEATLNAVCGILVALLSTRNTTTFWIFTALQGLIIGPLFPSGVAYANTMMDVSGVVISVINIGSSGGYFMYLWVSGKVYESVGPSAILYALLASGILTLASILCLLLLVRQRRKSCPSSDNNSPTELM